jgi:hypothetical protein
MSYSLCKLLFAICGGSEVAGASWTDTGLWKLLQSRPSNHFHQKLQAWLHGTLPAVEVLLSSAGTSPRNFTLHDDQHSFRVAERMLALLPTNTAAELSEIELGLLLASAYLHDIGMSPAFDWVQKVFDWLLDGLPAHEDSESLKLSQWIDRNFPDEPNPIRQDATPRDRRYRADYLTAYYCRHRHNDWSGEYILQQAASVPPYANFLPNLILLCRSHHFSIDELQAERFNAGYVAPNQRCNLRYLAAVLRVADVLEVDPERTPEVVFDQRLVDTSSVIYWNKDQFISIQQDTGGDIRIDATTPSAKLHKAVIETLPPFNFS